jgi:two-component system sensor histidine kinase QseC
VRSLRPLLAASEQAARVGPRHPRARIAVRNLPSEAAPLVDAVNGALDRLAGAYETERRFTQDAAHELRTPLAALTMRLQRARLGGVTDWDQVDRDLTHMRRLVSQLLDLARKESGRSQESAPAPVNLARLAREAAASLLPLVEHAGRTVDVDLPETAPVIGSGDDLRDMIRNLLENALAHGSGRIGLSLRVREALELDVTDEGPGVPTPLREAVFDRFRKVRQDGDGSGLGLAIARTVASRHGGTIAFLDAPTCRIRVLLPRAPAHSGVMSTAPALPKVA